MTAVAIDLREVCFRWPGASQDCLDIPALSIGIGERVFLHGPSGSGKSTLLNLLGGVMPPRAGHIAVLGVPLETLSASERDVFRADHIGIIFQQFNLLPWMNAVDNVQLAAGFSARRRRTIKSDDAQELLARLGLSAEDWQRPARALSVGQQQRVAAARALFGRPEILIADEPTSSLDSDLQRTFIDLLSEACSAADTTLVFVSHDRRLSVHFDRQIAMTNINRRPVR